MYGSRLWNSNLWFLVIHYMRTDCRTSILIVHWMEAGNIITYSYPILVVHYMGSFRSNSTFSFGWSQSSLLWSLGLLDSPAVTVCLWTIEIRRTRPFQLSSVSQQLATCVKSFFCLLMGILIFSLLKDQFTGRHIIDSLIHYYFDIFISYFHFTTRHIMDALSPHYFDIFLAERPVYRKIHYRFINSLLFDYFSLLWSLGFSYSSAVTIFSPVILGILIFFSSHNGTISIFSLLWSLVLFRFRDPAHAAVSTLFCLTTTGHLC